MLKYLSFPELILKLFDYIEVYIIIFINYQIVN